MNDDKNPCDEAAEDLGVENLFIEVDQGRGVKSPWDKVDGDNVNEIDEDDDEKSCEEVSR